MLKKIIVTTLVVIVMVSALVIPANALTMTEDDRPVGIIGIDLLMKYYEEYGNSEKEAPVPDYEIRMGKTVGLWVVVLEGEEDFEGYMACGCYYHYPTEEEIDILWANRLTEDEVIEMLVELN